MSQTNMMSSLPDDHTHARNVIPIKVIAAEKNLRNIAFEKHHQTVFHAWLNSTERKRLDLLQDRYIFYSICACIEAHLGQLLKIDLQQANAFVESFAAEVRQLPELGLSFGEEWYRGLHALSEALEQHHYLAPAQEFIQMSLDTGVNKFPRIAQDIQVQQAYLDARMGNKAQSGNIALDLIRKPYLLPGKRELPNLYNKLMHVLSASNHLAEYKLVLWKGASSFNASNAQRDKFTEQLVLTYRGALRCLVQTDIPLIYRFPFLLGNLARLVGKPPLFSMLWLNKPFHWLHLGTLYLLDFAFHKQSVELDKAVLRRLSRPDDAPETHGQQRASTTTSWSQRDKKKAPKKILITRAMGGLGDILMMSAGVHALRQRRPDTEEIHFATPKSFHGVLSGLEGVKLLDINETPIDLTQYKKWINLTDCPAGKVEGRQSPNVKRNRIEIFAKAMGIREWALRRLGGHLPRYMVSAQESAWAQQHLKAINPGGLPVLGVQPFAADTYRNWPMMEEFVLQVAQDRLVLVFHHEAVTGFEHPNVIKVRQPIRQSIALASLCQRLLVVDSSFLHISAALKVPTVAIFGAISGELRVKDYPNVQLLAPLKEEFPCYPCWRHEHKPCHLTQGRESICFHSITVKQAVNALGKNTDEWRVKPSMWQRAKQWFFFGSA
jgi:ADP-heptose:LPS heptosyltransferase